jgi:hypothetical protein
VRAIQRQALAEDEVAKPLRAQVLNLIIKFNDLVALPALGGCNNIWIAENGP